MKHLLFSLLFIFAFLKMQSQNFYIFSQEDNKPLKYCSVYSFAKNKIFYSNELGLIHIETESNDSISIKYIGYNSIIIKSSEIGDTVFLTMKSKELNEVKISKNKVLRSFGNFEYKKNHTMHYWIDGEFLRKIHINNENNSYKLKSIFIPFSFNKKYADSCFCSVNLYKLNDSQNNLESILKYPIFLNYKNNNNFYINIENQKIVRSDSFLFVGLDCIFIIPQEIMRKQNEMLINDNPKIKIFNSSPIKFYFKDGLVQEDKANGLSFFRQKSDQHTKLKTKWTPAWFTAGIEVISYE